MKTNNLEIEAKYYIEEECDGLIHYIIRKSDGKNIATLDKFSTEIMEYHYNDIMETRTCAFEEGEENVLEYFFGEYFTKPKCKITRNSIEHMIIKIFDCIKENYSLEMARRFYKEALYIRNKKLKEYEIKNHISNIVKSYIEVIYGE